MTEPGLDDLVQIHLDRFGDDDLLNPNRGVHANEILDAVHRGESFAPLGELLSGSGGARRTLTFILSEIGARASEVLSWVDELLGDDDPWIRRYAVQAVQHSEARDAATVVGKALALVDDEADVAAGVVRLLGFGSLASVETGVGLTRINLQECLRCLVDSRLEEWVRFVRSGDIGQARVGVAMARRLHDSGQPEPLQSIKAAQGELAAMATWIGRFRLPPATGSDILHRIEQVEKRPQ